jgi:hypothetical protein
MFDQILERLSSEIAQKIIEMTEAKISAGLAGRGAIHVSHAIAGTTPKRRGRPPKNAALALPAASSAKATKKSKIKRDMHCRVEGCKNRSKGPGFGYMCEEHMKLPKAEQRKAQDAYRVKHAGK